MFAHILLVSLQLFLLPIWPLVSFLQCCQWQIYTMNKLKLFWINLSRWQHCMYEGTTRFGNYLPKSFFSGNTGIDGKIAKSSKMISEIWQTLLLYVSTKWTTARQLVFVCSHILKLNKAECVHTMPQKRELRPKPVPGQGCLSLKLRLSRSNPFFRQRLSRDFKNVQRCSIIPTGPFTNFEPQDQEIGEFYVIQERRTTNFEAQKLWKGRLGSFHSVVFYIYGYPTDRFTTLVL